MARIVQFADGSQSETTPTIGNIVASGLVVYPDDATYEATELNAPAEGNVYFNSTDNVIRYYNGTQWGSLVDETTSQTLENKSIDADQNTVTNIDNDNIKAGAAIDATKIHDGSVDNTEFGYLNGVTSAIQTQLDDKIPLSQKGAVNGVATLNGSGVVPDSQLPSYVDDVLEYANLAAFPVTGETGKIYIAIDSGSTYRWSGSMYVQISSSGANQSLSNLTDPTAVNQHLLPDSSNTRDLGSNSSAWRALFLKADSLATRTLATFLNFSGGTILRIMTGASAPDGSATSVSISTATGQPADDFAIHTGNSADADATGNLFLGTGNNSSTGDTGSVTIRTGEPVSGTRGKIQLQDGSEGTTGHVWTSTDANGSGEWAAPIENRIQTKILSGNVITNITISDLTFNNLVIGKWYEVSGAVYLAVNDGLSDTSIEFNAIHDSATIHRAFLRNRTSSDTLDDINIQGISFKFQATATTLEFQANSASANSYIGGTNTLTGTHIQLEERNDLVGTTAFS